MPKIVRLTLFKIPEAELIQETINKYSTLSQDAVKGDSKYILHAHATPTYDDPRNQGFTLVTRVVFDSKEDMDYYDNECAAHGQIKAALKGKLPEPPCVLYMDSD